MNESRRFDFQQPHSMFGTWMGVVLLFVVFALFVWVVLGAIPRGDDYEQKRAKSRLEKLEQLQKTWTAALTSYAWIDKNKGTVRIPVERAMDLELTDLSSKKPAAAYPIATPTPAAAAASPGAPAPPARGAASPTPKPISVEGPKSEIRGQPTGAANPAAAPPGTQPGPSATPAPSPPSGAAQPNPGGKPLPTPVQSPPGSPLPVRGKTPP
jgi:hypothetical protein